MDLTTTFKSPPHSHTHTLLFITNISCSRMHKCHLHKYKGRKSKKEVTHIYLIHMPLSYVVLSLMGWFSWLSKTSLNLTLVYDYGVVFACNELTAEPIPHFDHEFLRAWDHQSKHRLEIIKLARSEAKSKAGSASGRVREALNRTKRRVVACAKNMMTLQQKNPKLAVKYCWRRGEQRKEGDEEGKGQVFMLSHNSHDEQWGGKSLGFKSPLPRLMMSGPLERNNKQAKITSRGHSGPLKPSGWLHEKSGDREGKKSPVVALTQSMCRAPGGLRVMMASTPHGPSCFRT